MNLKKNDIITTKIIGIGINGEGIAKVANKILFVPFALKGEEVEVKIIKLAKAFVVGKLIKVLIPSKNRVNPICPVFTKCGGCQLQHMSYENQLEFKKELVVDTLKKVGNINIDILDCVPSKDIFNYRNKISLPIRSVAGELKIGCFAGGSHRVVETEECFLQKALTNKLIKVFKKFLIENNIEAYDEETKTGLVKYLVAREFNEALLIVVVINGNTLPYLNKLEKLLTNEFKNVSLYINENTKDTNVILSKINNHIFGDKFLTEKLNGIENKTGVLSFMQVNNDVRNKIYNKTLEFLQNAKAKTIIDAYSGAGLLTGIIAKNIEAKVYGLEIVPEAVEASNKMLAKNGLEKQVTNILGDCSVTLPKLIKKLDTETSVVLDPPRKGVDKKVVEAILKAKPEQIIYIACGVTSLARDLAYLTNTKDIKTGLVIKTPNSKYKIKDIILFDMFPQTKHIETLVELEIIKN